MSDIQDEAYSETMDEIERLKAEIVRLNTRIQWLEVVLRDLRKAAECVSR
jgi:hypothetical protein